MKAAVVSAVVLIGAAGIVPVATRDDASPTLQVIASDTLNGKAEAAPTEFNEFARSLYDTQQQYCRQPWSALLFEAGERQSRPFSRRALREVASKLPHARRYDQLLINIATEGCVAGFLVLLKSNRSYALS